jgi:hypothetical protein
VEVGQALAAAKSEEWAFPFKAWLIASIRASLSNWITPSLRTYFIIIEYHGYRD